MGQGPARKPTSTVYAPASRSISRDSVDWLGSGAGSAAPVPVAEHRTPAPAESYTPRSTSAPSEGPPLCTVETVTVAPAGIEKLYWSTWSSRGVTIGTLAP